MLKKINIKNLAIIDDLAFDFQKVKGLPINKFDKKVDLIVTNKKIYK